MWCFSHLFACALAKSVGFYFLCSLTYTYNIRNLKKRWLTALAE